MELPLSELLKYAEANPDRIFNLGSTTGWLAAKCASQLAGTPQVMHGWRVFGPRALYSAIPEKYANFCADFCHRGGRPEEHTLTGKEIALKIRAMMDEEPDQPIIIGG